MEVHTINIELNGNIQYRRNGDTVECIVQYITEELSEAILISSDPRICTGEDVILRIFLPLERSPIKCIGRITRRSESDGLFEYSRGYLARMFITYISRVDRRRLELIISQRKTFTGFDNAPRLRDSVTPIPTVRTLDRSDRNGRDTEVLVTEIELLKQGIARLKSKLKDGTEDIRKVKKLDAHNVLIVDDEVANLNALERTLRPLKRFFETDYNVFSATNGEDAWSILEENEIAFIIADQRMPGMTGVELLEKTLDKYPDIIRMILTAYTDEKLLLDAINRVHVHGYINKPWEPQEIIDIVRQGLEAHGAIPIPNTHVGGRTDYVLK
jgi:CheY-like chemotaxis protein